jgi:putative transposase
MSKYSKPREAAEYFGVSLHSLRRWEKEDKIQAIRTPSGQRRYDIASYTGISNQGRKRTTIAYARVSSRGQKADLVRDRVRDSAIDRLQSFSNSILKLNSSLISPVVLISKDQDLEPFWNESVAAMSNLLWSPTKIDSPVLGLTSFNGGASKTARESWFSTKTVYPQNENWSRTYLPLFTSMRQAQATPTVADCTDLENTNLQSKKIRIYPSSELEKVWKQWLAACRYCYNQAIAKQRESNTRISRLKLRNLVMQSDLPAWVKETPCHIRQNAIFDAHQAYSASRNARFKSIREPRQTIKFNPTFRTSGFTADGQR